MRVFLGNAPWAKPGFYGVRAGSRWPHYEEEQLEYMPFPFFLAYATAVLERAGHDTLLIDGCAEKTSRESFVERAVDFRPDVVVLEASTISIDTDLAVARELRQRLPRATLAFAGLHAFMYEPAWLAEHGDLDVVLVGEYELTLLELTQRLAAGASFKGCAGLLWRDGDAIVDEGRRPLEENLDRFPWPARHFLPMHEYHDEPGSIPRPSVQMWASRGCPFGCVFCAWPQIMYDSRKYRMRAVVDTVDEMEWLVRRGGFKSVYFDDDTFNVHKKRTIEFAHEIKRRNLNVPWAIMARIDRMDREVLEALKDAGLYSLKYGIETANPELIAQADKSLDLDKAREIIELTHELDIKMHLTFMFGLPGETRATAKRTVDLALWADPESLQFTIATPFPGSKYHKLLKEQGRLLSDDFDKYDGFRSAVIRTDHLSPQDLEEIVGDANRKWQEHRWLRENPDHRTNVQKAIDLAKQPRRIPDSIKRALGK